MSLPCRQRFDAVLWYYEADGPALKERIFKGCRKRTDRFREADRVLRNARSLDKIKKHTDFKCFCEIVDL